MLLEIWLCPAWICLRGYIIQTRPVILLCTQARNHNLCCWSAIINKTLHAWNKKWSYLISTGVGATPMFWVFGHCLRVQCHMNTIGSCHVTCLPHQKQYFKHIHKTSKHIKRLLTLCRFINLLGILLLWSQQGGLPVSWSQTPHDQKWSYVLSTHLHCKQTKLPP